MARKLEDEGPQYHCPTCLLPERNLPEGCPKCPLTMQVNRMKERVREEVVKRYATSRLYPRWDLDMSYEEGIEVYSFISGLLESNYGRPNVEWDETIYALAKIVVSEREQARSVEMYALRRQAAAARRH